jgi:hypothetical protein
MNKKRLLLQVQVLTISADTRLKKSRQITFITTRVCSKCYKFDAINMKNLSLYPWKFIWFVNRSTVQYCHSWSDEVTCYRCVFSSNEWNGTWETWKVCTFIFALNVSYLSIINLCKSWEGILKLMSPPFNIVENFFKTQWNVHT